MVLAVHVGGEREHGGSCSTTRRRPVVPTRAGTLDVVTPLTVSVWTVDLDQPLAVVDALRAMPRRRRSARAAAARRDDTVRNRYVVAHGALAVDPRRPARGRARRRS